MLHNLVEHFEKKSFVDSQYICELCNRIYQLQKRGVSKKSFNRKLRNLIKSMISNLLQYKEINTNQNIIYRNLIELLIKKGANYMTPIDILRLKTIYSNDVDKNSLISSIFY